MEERILEQESGWKSKKNREDLVSTEQLLLPSILSFRENMAEFISLVSIRLFSWEESLQPDFPFCPNIAPADDV
jgi:hypothetical protein